MKAILLIGLGRFGRHIAQKLNELNHQVMVVDRVESRVNAVLPFVTNAQIGDSTDEEFLSSLGVRNFDVCIVAIGDNFQSSLETASLLNWGQKRWSHGPHGMYRQNFCCAMARMKSYTLKSRWRSGQLSDTAPIISRIIFHLGTIRLFSKYLYRIAGPEKPSDS